MPSNRRSRKAGPILCIVGLVLLLHGCGDSTDRQQAEQPISAYPSDLLRERVEAGEWTVEEGLIANLKILAGEVEAETVYGKDAERLGESEVLIRMARSYLRHGDDDRARAEIERLLDEILVDTDRLRREAVSDVAAAQSGLGGPWWFRGLKAAMPIARADTDCGAVWAGDWPQPDPDTGACVLKNEWEVDGSGYRIHYPGQWRVPGHRELAYVERTREAMQRSTSRYRALGRMGDVDVFLGLSAPGEKAWAFPDRSPEEACEVHVFRDAIASENERYYPFFIAHELFHCFQGLNLGRAYWGVAGRGIRHHTFTAWWVEGSANYFADTLYPDSDYEIHKWRGDFDRLSPDVSLVNMDYESVFFFQFLGARVTDEQIIDWLRRLPGRGDSDAQARALAGWGDMQAAFHAFGKAYLEKRLEDAGGTVIPFEPDRGPVTTQDAPGFGVLARPFVLHRERVEFPEGKGFEVEATPAEPPPGRYSVRPQPDGEWRKFPARIPDPCGGRDTYQLLLTSASGGRGSHQLDVALEDLGGEGSGPANVDSCLTGKWEAVPESLEDSMASMASGVSGFRDVEVEAESWVCFNDAGFIEGHADMRTEWRFVLPGESSHKMRSLVTIQGSFSGRYSIEGNTIELSEQANDVTADSQAWLDGKYIGEGGTVHMPDLPGRSRSTGDEPYRCSGDRLEWTPPVPGMRPEPVVYERVSPS